MILETQYVIARGVRSRLSRARPLFPRYLFVQPPGGRWHFLLSTYGVSSIILGGFGERPAEIRHEEIARLKAREENGIVVLPPRPKFEAHTRVRITRGAFAGYVGLVQGNSPQQRIQVLLEFLGRKTSTLVTESVLEAA